MNDAGEKEREREQEKERVLAVWQAAAVTAVREGAGRVYQLVRGQKGQRNAVLLSLVRLFDPQAGGSGALSAPSSSAAAALPVEGGAGAGATKGSRSSDLLCMDFPT